MNHLVAAIGRFWRNNATVLHLLLLLGIAYVAMNWVFGVALWGPSARTVQPGASMRQSAEWLRMLDDWDNVRDGGMHLTGTLTTEEGERIGIVEIDSQRRTVRLGEAVGEGFVVSELGQGRMVLRRDVDVQVLELSARMIAPQSVQSRQTMRADIVRDTAVAMISEVQWQVIPIGGGFVALRVTGALPKHVGDAYGLSSGDVLEAVNGLPIKGNNAVERLHDRFRSDELVTLGLRRGQRRLVSHISLHD